MLKRILRNSDVSVWLFFGSHIPEQLVDEQLSEFCPTQVEVDKSLAADSWISQTTILNPPSWTSQDMANAARLAAADIVDPCGPKPGNGQKRGQHPEHFFAERDEAL